MTWWVLCALALAAGQPCLQVFAPSQLSTHNATSDAGVSPRIPLSQALTSRKGPLTAKYKSKGLSAFGQLLGETR